MEVKSKIILLSGFLGSGKTTLLRHIMSFNTDMSDTVIIMNEYGEVGIDGMLLKDKGVDIVELTSGCICCSMSDDLQETIAEILQRFGPRYIIIEATGVADPESVSNVIADADFKNDVEIHKILTVMDAECWKVRDVFGTLFYRQLKQADTIILNKIDLLDKHEIPNYLEEIHQVMPDAQVIPTVNCRIEPEVVWFRHFHHNLFARVPDSQNAECQICKHGICHHHVNETEANHRHDIIFADKNFVTFSFSESAPLDEIAFNRFVQEMPWELFRLKGTLNFGDRTVMINSVGGKTEREPWEKASETRLAFVGWNIDPDDFLAQLKTCIRK